MTTSIRINNVSKLLLILNRMTAFRVKMEKILEAVTFAMSERRIDNCSCVDTRKLVLGINHLIHKEEQLIEAINSN